MRGIGKDWKPLVRELRAAGCEIETGGKHYTIKRDGKTVGHLPISPSDRRALLNKRAQLRTAGVL